MQMDLFPNNTKTHFDTFIDKNNLDYLPNFDIEAAIKSITFDNRRTSTLLKDEVLTICTNICKPAIRNGGFDRIISMFIASKSNTDVTHIDFKNPIFFETTKENLTRASFQIRNIDTDKAPNFTSGSPTFIQLVVKKTTPRMKKPFNVFLDSSDKKSNALYTSNSNMEFTVVLPDILEFKRDWHVTLKSLYIPNLLYNVYKDACLFTYDDSGEETHENLHILDSISEGCYPTLTALLEVIQTQWDMLEMPLNIYEKKGKVKIEYKYGRNVSRVRQLYLNPTLAHMLGFNFAVDYGQFLRFDQDIFYEAAHKPNLYLLTPKNIIVSCSIVDESIFGGQHLKVLRLVTNNLDHSSDILSFEFHSNEYIELKTKCFENITIRLSDVSGNVLKSASLTPTRLQLTFINT